MARVAVLVISSKVVEGSPDEVRPVVDRLMEEVQGTLVGYVCVPDEREAIRKELLRLCETEGPDLLLTVGGTGVRPTDWAPEATRDVVEREVPGIGEAMRQESLKKVRTAMLSRGTAGIRGETLIVNLPGSAKGVRENFNVLRPILDHTLEKIRHRAPSSR